MAFQGDFFRKNADDEYARILQTSGYGHAIATVDGSHDAIHHGYAYSAHHFYDEVVNAASADLLIVTADDPGPGAQLHVQEWQVTTEDGPAFLYLYEGTTTSDDGTAVSRVNHNRQHSSRVSGATVFHTPTVTDVGTLLWSQPIYDPGSNQAAKPQSAVIPGQIEWLLGTGSATKYLLRVTNSSGGAMDVWQRVFWYERDQQRPDLR